MRKPYALMVLGLLLILSACTRPAPPVPVLDPTEVPQTGGETPTGQAPTSEQPSTDPYPAPETLTPPPTSTPFPTSVAAEPTATQVPPTQGAAATTTSAPPTTAATNTPGPTATPTLPPFNPKASLGSPTFRDPMGPTSNINWSSDGVLPDTDNIELELEDDQLLVTGRNIQFDTWWFSWPTMDDFFIQMEVETDQCSGRDAYGLILRGPPKGTGDAWGYIVALSCDGQYLVRRVDSANPYLWVDLVPWTSNVNIKTGSDKTNSLGVEMVGGRIRVYANQFQIAQINDSSYDEGRYGVYINAGQTVNFTYRVEEISYWDLN